MNQHGVAESAQRQHRQVVALSRTVGQKPSAASTPRFGREPEGSFERGGTFAQIDPVHHGHQVKLRETTTKKIVNSGGPSGTPTVTGKMEPHVVRIGVIFDGIRVRRLRLQVTGVIRFDRVHFLSSRPGSAAVP